VSRRRSVDWKGYLGGFHGASAGITEDLLGPARDLSGRSPYEWLLDARPDDSRSTVDIGCGSAPTGAEGHRWVGLDRSFEELRHGVERGRGAVVQGDAASIPFAAGSATTVICSMSLMVVDDPAATLAEARRVLASAGTMLVLTPAAAPMTLRDRARMGAVMLVVGTPGFPFPHREVMRHTADQIAAAGFDVVSDECRRFAVPLSAPQDGERFVRSLYLPGVSDRRRRLARRLARRWRGALGIPLRRVVAHSIPPTRDGELVRGERDGRRRRRLRRRTAWPPAGAPSTTWDRRGSSGLVGR
jgi:SAM-dependent methyltransferase